LVWLGGPVRGIYWFHPCGIDEITKSEEPFGHDPNDLPGFDLRYNAAQR